jgi:anti-sigma B factor antagonist
LTELSQVEFSGDDVVVARLSGEIDLSNAQDVGETLAAAVPNTAFGLVIDLTATAYLDSSGVHLLFELAERLQRRQQQMRVVVPDGGPIRRVLRIVELDATVPILSNVDEAVEQIRAAA